MTEISKARKSRTEEVLERVDARFAELVELGAFTPEKHQEVSAYIQGIRDADRVRMGDGYKLASYMYDCPYWLLLGEENPNEILISVRNPYPPQTKRHFKK